MSSPTSEKTRHPLTWVPTLQTASGIPFTFIALVTSIMYKVMGVSNAKITFWTGLIGFAWSIKPLWGGFLEMFKTRKYFVILTECVTGVSFMMVAITLQTPSFFGWSMAAFGLMALSGAVSDTAGDGVYINALSSADQAKYIGWNSGFWQVGKILSTGAIPTLAGILLNKIGVFNAWSAVTASLGLFFLLLALYHYYFLPSGGTHAAKVETVGDTAKAFWDVVATFFKKKYIWWGMAFLVFYRFAEGQAMKVIPLFLVDSRAKGGLGLSTQEVGLSYGFLPPLAMLAGTFLGGHIAAKYGLKKTIIGLCAAFNIPLFIYTYIALVRPTSLTYFTGLVTLEYLFYGIGAVALQLFMMQQIAHGKYKTSHYAFASSLFGLGFMLPGLVSGWLSEYLGYQKFFIWILVCTIPAFLLCWMVPFHNDADTSEEENASA